MIERGLKAIGFGQRLAQSQLGLLDSVISVIKTKKPGTSPPTMSGM